MRQLGLSVILVMMVIVGSSCALIEKIKGDPESLPMTFERYDHYTNSLRIAVRRGELTTTEAERLRKEAYRDYLNYLKEKTIEREGTRNW